MKREIGNDQLSLLSAGVAFYGLLSLVPALGVLVTLFAPFSDSLQVPEVVEGLQVIPRRVRIVLTEQLEQLNRASSTTKGVSLLAGTILSLWSASRALRATITAMNLAYEEIETRGWLHRTLLGVGFTVVSIAAGFVALLVIAVLPAFFEGRGVTLLALLVPWIVTFVGFSGWLSILYRFGPSRENARWRWITPGSIVASLLWLLGSLAFSAYVASFGRYNETYGSMGATVVLLLWMWVSAWTVLLGAELNAEMEHQTRQDSTTGQTRPRGARGAFVADHVADVPDKE